MHKTQKIKKQNGLSLIELMIAVVVSLFLIGGLLQLLMNNMQTYRTHVALTRIQENSRFIFQELAREIRMAGMAGCSRFPQDASGNLSVVLGTLPSGIMHDFSVTSFVGYDSKTADGISGSDFANDIDPDSNVLLIKRMSETSTYLDSLGISYDHDSDTETVSIPRPYLSNDGTIGLKDISEAPTFTIGDTLIINDCVGNVGVTKVIGTADITTQNKLPINPLSHNFPLGSEIGKLNSAAYYIGAVGQNSRTEKTLVKYTLSHGGEPIIQDLITGIESLNIFYGIDTDNNSVADNFIPASTVTTNATWTKVVAIRINFSISPPAAFTRGMEGHILHHFSTVINLRNPIYDDS